VAREALKQNSEAQERKNKKLVENNKKRWKENPEFWRKQLKKANKKRWESEKAHLDMSKRCTERNKKCPPRKNTITSKEGRANIALGLKNRWKIPTEKMLNRDTAHHGKEHPMYDKFLTIELLQKYVDKKLVEVCNILNVTPSKVRNRIRVKGFNTWNEFCSKYNHKVIKIEKLDVKDETWDIEVEGTHNFATSSGVFVHNSVDTIQILKKKGIRAEYLSVDRSIEPYQTLKESIYGGNISCHKMEVLLDELSRLEITKAQKVDHPPGSSKDVADAVCGAVYMCVKEAGEQMGMSSGSYYSDQKKAGGMSPAQAEKEAYYRNLEEMNSKGLLA